MCGVKQCCVNGCKNSSKNNITLHSFPSDPNLKMKWFKSIFNLNGTNESSNLYICRKHFEGKCYLSTNTKKLRPDSIPTLFLNNTPLHLENCEDDPSERMECENILNLQESKPSTSSLFSDDVPPLLEEPQPWRFNQEIENNSMPSGFVSDCCSDKFRLLHIIQGLQKELTALKRNYARLHDKHEKLLSTHRNTEKSKAEICVAKIKRDSENLNPHATFILDQVHNYSLKTPRWSELTIRQCIAWRHTSPNGYEFGRKSILRAPSRNTLSRYMGSLESGKELPNLIVDRLKTESQNLQEVEKVCSLIVEDVTIKKKLYYNRSAHKIYGMSAISRDIFGKRPVIANKLLCFVIHGLSTKYTIPVGYFFHKSLTSERFYEITLEIIKMARSCGFTVFRIVSDNHKSNDDLFKLLGQFEDKSGSEAAISRTKTPTPAEPPLVKASSY